VGSPFTYQITATNSPTTYGATNLPAGLSLDTTTGQISGMPTVPLPPATYATSIITLSATNSSGTGTASLLFTIYLTQEVTATTFIPPNGGANLVTNPNFPGNAQLDINAHANQEQSAVAPSALIAHHALLQQNSASTVPVAGVAIIDESSNGILVSEAGVPASPQVTSGQVAAEIHATVTTGVALSNLTATNATITFYFNDAAGNQYGAGSLVLASNSQMHAYFDQAPFSLLSALPSSANGTFVGTFTFTSSVPVGVIALRGLTNELGVFLMTTLPVNPLNGTAGPAVIPQLADGGGWSTEVILTNSSDTPEKGTLQFYAPGATGQTPQLLNLKTSQLLNITVDPKVPMTFDYEIPANGTAILNTSGAGPSVQVGSTLILGQASSLGSGETPTAVAVLSFQNNGTTVSQISVPASSEGTAFRVYVESSGGVAQPGSVQSGMVIVNPSGSDITATINLTWIDGADTGLTQSVTVPAGGQVARFFDELFQQLPANFRGIARITAPSPVDVAALRARYNQNGDFLMTTTPPLNENALPIGGMELPHIVGTGNYSTDIVIFGATGAGEIYMYSQDGTTDLPASLTPVPAPPHP
jgi:hypothetical protein